MVEVHVQHCHTCQVVTVSQEKETLRMLLIPSETWQEVTVDCRVPIQWYASSQDGLRWSLSQVQVPKVVLPKLDRMFAALGIPVTVGSDNEPPFNGSEFSDFSKYLGFNHQCNWHQWALRQMARRSSLWEYWRRYTGSQGWRGQITNKRFTASFAHTGHHHTVSRGGFCTHKKIENLHRYVKNSEEMSLKAVAKEHNPNEKGCLSSLAS